MIRSFRSGKPKAETASSPENYLLSTEYTEFSISENDFDLTRTGDSSFAIIGQERAMLAMDLGLKIRAKGYNLFVTGPAGTGKRTAIDHALKNLPHDPERLLDICLVHNFKEDESPRPIYLKSGKGREFKAAMRNFLLQLSRVSENLSKDGEFRAMRDRLLIATETEQQGLLRDFEKRLQSEGFKIVEVSENEQQKADILPLIDNQISDFESLQTLVSEGKMTDVTYSSLRERQRVFIDEMKELFDTVQGRRTELQGELDSLRKQLLEPRIADGIARLREAFDFDGVGAFLSEVKVHLESPGSFIYVDGKSGEQMESASSDPRQAAVLTDKSVPNPHISLKYDFPEHLRIYDINVLVDHGDSKENPVIIEQYPDYTKLFGNIETPPESGTEFVPPFMLVKAGSLLKASGGCLVLRAEDLLRDEDVYVGLKRALQEQAVEIRAPSGPYGPSTQTIKPEPIKIDLKLIVMGGDGLYEMLFEKDEDFQKLFKVPAEFDSTVDRTPQICQAYADFFTMICREDKLPPLSKGAVASLLEYAVRVSEFRNKLSTRFSLLADIVRESAYWSALQKPRRNGNPEILREDVEKALQARGFLYNLPEEKIDEQILQGEILMRVEGSAVGRINALAVMDRGYYSFGRPTVISAQAAPGSEGVVNVERESGLSGEIHDKGTFIVASYIQATYARDFPLSIHASICFEQSYTEIDGDSASSAELYALLSSIGGFSLRQDIAVTGSVSQMGQIQPVGGVVEKIEGFYYVCKKVGLTGRQGVIIPHQNTINLILNREVQKAIAEGSFHVWAIQGVDEGMEILSGTSSGTRNAKGFYPVGSTNAAVEKRLREMARATKDFEN